MLSSNTVTTFTNGIADPAGHSLAGGLVLAVQEANVTHCRKYRSICLFVLVNKKKEFSNTLLLY
jgi:hypothetical protein